ncbi:MAG: hypothetical protein Q9201_007607 [Fulgogasparrea decipioides]
MSKKSQMLAGPRPMNTLSRGATDPRQPLRSSWNGLPQGNRARLETATSSGNNVKVCTLEFDHDSLLSNGPRPKRQKLEPQRNSQNTPQVLDGSEDEDQLMMDDIVGIRHVSQAPKDSAPHAANHSLHSENISRTERRDTGIREYKNVETLMDSSLPRNNKRRNRQRHGTHDASTTPRSSFASSPSDSIEVLNVDNAQNPVVKTRYRGTANLHPTQKSQAISNGSGGHDTGNRSPHFALPNDTKSTGARLEVNELQHGLPAPQIRLTETFRDTNGKIRGGTESISSDELFTAVSNPRALSPLKSTRSPSPVKIPQADTSIPVMDDESPDSRPAQSNIRPSTFTKATKTRAHSASRTFQSDYREEKPAPWSISLQAYNFHGQTHKDDSLGLVYNENNKSYEIHHNGANLAKRYPELRIQPAKLLRIFWALDGTKMRFQSCKTGNIDNVLDLEMCKEKDVQELNAMLQESAKMAVKGETPEKMDQLFDHKLQEYRKSKHSNRPSASEQPDDVLLAQRRLERADQKRASGEHHEVNTKRPRMIDSLRSDEQRDSHPRAQQVQFSSHNHTEKQKAAVGGDRFITSGRDQLTLLDDNLKRSLRSHTGSGLLSRRTQEVSPKPPDAEVPRYSKIYGLGRRWPKPLEYPKDAKKRTTVYWADLERLDEGEFLNDNLILFYLRYLENKAEQADPTVSRKVYMFNSFFYERLTTTDNGHKGINYEAVRKWTRGVDLFTYDFVVVPVNESAHWYVAIICNLPALQRQLGGFDGEDGHAWPTRDDEISPSSLRRVSNEENARIAAASSKYMPEDANEQEAAASFAEMSLEATEGATKENNPGPNVPETSHLDATDQQMLDDQLQASVEPSNEGQALKAEELERDLGEDDEIVKMEKATPTQLKKGKKKSLPSPRTFDPSKPTILTFDSFGTAHSATIRALKDYLHEEANDKRGMDFDAKGLQGVTAKRIPLQDNFCDCGVFLLGYMEKFFENPREFINKIMRVEWDIKADWAKLDPSKIRTKMRKILMGLEEERRNDFIRAKQAKKTSKPTEQVRSSPSRSGEGKVQPPKPANEDEVEQPHAETVPGAAREATPSPRVAALESALKNDVPKQQAPADAESKSSGTTAADKEPAAEAAPPPPAPAEQPPQSFIVLDSQSQAANPQSAAEIPISLQDTESPAVSPELPSTIQDSQPPTPEPLEHLPEAQLPPRAALQGSRSSPPSKHKPRRIESFSSPPAPPGKTPVTQEEPKTPSSKGTRRSIEGAKSGVTGTHLKVIINIDD